MDPNACPRCGKLQYANGACGCGWPRAKVRGKPARVLTDRAASFVALGKGCAVLGCPNPHPAARGLCWPHYRLQLERIPANPGKGLGCYRGRSRRLIQELASIKRARIYGTKERLSQARILIFDTAGGRIMKLPRKQRQFVNHVNHESYDIYLVRCLARNTPAMSFKAFRRRWYGAQKTNWRRFDVPREMSETWQTATEE